MGSPEVSVVMAAYNAGRWIAESLASVAAQDLDSLSLEVVVVDDGSSDDTVAVARRVLAEAGLTHVIIEQSNSGPSVARNAGLARARGAWIQFLDADDLLAPSKVSRQLQAARLAPPATGAIFSEFSLLTSPGIDGPWVVGPLIRPRPDPVDPLSILHADNFLPLASQLMRREAIAAVGRFPDDRLLVEDVWLVFRLAHAGYLLRFEELGQPGYLYRRTPRSLSARARVDLLDGMIANATRAEDMLRDQGPLNAARIDLLSQCYHYFLYEASHLAPSRLGPLVARLQRLGADIPAMSRGGRIFRSLVRVFGLRHAHRIFGPLRNLRRNRL